MVSGIGGERKGVVGSWGRGLDVEGIIGSGRMGFQSVATGGTVCPVHGGFPNVDNRLFCQVLVGVT